MVVRGSTLYVSTLSGTIALFSLHRLGDQPFEVIQGSPLAEGFYSRLDVSYCGQYAVRGSELFQLTLNKRISLGTESNGVAFHPDSKVCARNESV